MSMILDGSNGVTFNDSSLQGAAASPYGLKNRIINGDMRIDQRNAGASVTASTTAAQTYASLDRWAYIVSQASKFTMQQNAGSVTPPAGFKNYLGCTSTAATSVGSSDYFNVNQPIEGFNVADLDWGTANAKTVTISFWVRSSLTGTFGGSIRNSVPDRSYPFSYTISSANTWTQISITIPGDTTGTWGTTNGIGIHVNFSLGMGSTFSSTANSWQAGNYVSVTGSTSVVGTNGATWYITGVQLEVGSTATPFERRMYGQELALCQRYYQYFGGENAYNYFGGTASITSTTNAFLPIIFMTQMRAAPSFTYVGALSTFDLRSSGNASHTPSALAQDITTSKVFALQITSSGLTANTPGVMIGANSTAGQLCFSAEL